MARLEQNRIAAGRPNVLEQMTVEELAAEKDAIKRELKNFDMSFKKKYGRMVRDQYCN
jgi:hypothetical protein